MPPPLTYNFDMPIRLNLLAEAHAAESSRRKDPLKRTIWITGFLAFLVLLYSSTLQLQLLTARSESTASETKWRELAPAYQKVVESRRKTIEVEQKLLALQQLTTNRFLWGTALNALQHATVDGIQFVRLKGEQLYTLNDPVKARTNGTQIIQERPATATEKVTLTLDAKDTNAQAGEQINRFKQVLSNVAFFKTHLQKTNAVLLTSLSPPQLDAVNSGRAFVLFTLQCYFPEKIR